MSAEVKQLSALDTQFLAIENDRNYGHTGGLAVLDPSTAPGGQLTLEDLKGFISSRLHLIPPFTSRLAQVPFNLDWPYWVKDEHFDIGYHVREIALPPPGDQPATANRPIPSRSASAALSAALCSSPYPGSGEESRMPGRSGARTLMPCSRHHGSAKAMSSAQLMPPWW